MAIVTKVRYWKVPTKPFWENTKINESSGCIEWIGTRHPQGYGLAVKRVGEPAEQRAHRRSWEMAHGEIPAGMHVLHKCDNPSCVNPDHLFLGTDADNTKDKYAKGRAVNLKGERHGMSRVTADCVLRIREAVLFGARPIDMARAYGVSDAAIHSIINRRNWAHV